MSYLFGDSDRRRVDSRLNYQLTSTLAEPHVLNVRRCNIATINCKGKQIRRVGMVRVYYSLGTSTYLQHNIT